MPMFPERSPEISTLPFCEITPQHTSAEAALLVRLTQQRVRMVLVPMCRGLKFVQDAYTVRNIHKPTSWEDLHPDVRRFAMDQLHEIWSRRFGNTERQRPFQHVLEVAFPQGTRYRCSLVSDLHPEGISIISPFKLDIPREAFTPESPAPSLSFPY